MIRSIKLPPNVNFCRKMFAVREGVCCFGTCCRCAFAVPAAIVAVLVVLVKIVSPKECFSFVSLIIIIIFLPGFELLSIRTTREANASTRFKAAVWGAMSSVVSDGSWSRAGWRIWRRPVTGASKLELSKPVSGCPKSFVESLWFLSQEL